MPHTFCCCQRSAQSHLKESDKVSSKGSFDEHHSSVSERQYLHCYFWCCRQERREYVDSEITSMVQLWARHTKSLSIHSYYNLAKFILCHSRVEFNCATDDRVLFEECEGRKFLVEIRKEYWRTRICGVGWEDFVRLNNVRLNISVKERILSLIKEVHYNHLGISCQSLLAPLATTQQCVG